MNKSRIMYTAVLAAAIAGYSLSINGATESFQLLSPEEAQEVEKQLSTLQGEERERYRMEVYETLTERAHAAGYQMPAIPEDSAATIEPPASEAPQAVVTTPTAEDAPTTEAPPAATEEQAAPTDAAPPAIVATPLIVDTPPVDVPAETPPTAAEEQPVPAPVAPAEPAVMAAPAAPPVPPDTTPYQSEEEILSAMDKHREAMREYMKQRRAQQAVEMERRHGAPPANRSMAQIEQKRAMREQQRAAYAEQMEARRKAMQQQLDTAINSFGAPPVRAPYPAYPRPYPYPYPYYR